MTCSEPCSKTVAERFPSGVGRSSAASASVIRQICAGSYQASKLASEEAVIEVSGAGKAVVNATNSLEVDISGAGAVEYLGDPKVKQSISGIGKVRRREPS